MLFVQVIVRLLTLQLQAPSLPAAAPVGVNPTGIAKLVVSVPPVGPGPLLPTATENFTPCWPWVNVPVDGIEIVTAGRFWVKFKHQLPTVAWSPAMASSR